MTFDLTISEPEVPRPDKITVTVKPLSRPFITQLVAEVFLHDPAEELTETDLTEPSESVAFHFTLITPAAFDEIVGVIASLPDVILPFPAIRKRPYPLE